MAFEKNFYIPGMYTLTFNKSEVFVTKFIIYEEGMLMEIYFETKFYVENFYQGDGYPIIHD